MAERRRLGRGLDALLGEYAQPLESITTLPVHDIDTNREQPRKQFDQDKLDELADSIRKHGVVQPILVRRVGQRYTIVAGERRYRAARQAGLTEIPVVVREFEDDQVLEVALIENLQREDLNPIEEAMALRFLMQQHDLTQEEVAERISKSRPAIANALRLLALPPSVQDLLREGKLTSGHARALAGMKDAGRAAALADEAVAAGYTVRKVEELAKEDRPRPKQEKPRMPDAAIYDAQETLQARLETRVRIEGNDSRGRIVIEYYSKEELNRLYDLLVR